MKMTKERLERMAANAFSVIANKNGFGSLWKDQPENVKQVYRDVVQLITDGQHKEEDVEQVYEEFGVVCPNPSEEVMAGEIVKLRKNRLLFDRIVIVPDREVSITTKLYRGLELILAYGTVLVSEEQEVTYRVEEVKLT